MRNERQFESTKHGPLNILGLLNSCTATKNLGEGSRLHAYIQKHKILEENIYIGSSLINMYAKCGALSKAQGVLEELPVRNVVTWSALIAGYAQHGQGEEALKCFDDMLHEGHSPDAITFACALKACGSIRAVAKGEEIHDNIVSLGMLEKDIVLCNTLVDMYVKWGSLQKAQQVLQGLPMRDAVAWSSLIAGYALQGQGEEALKCFNDMLHEGHSANAITFICALKACGSIGAAVKGEEIHDKIVSCGMLENDLLLGSTLMHMYIKCGALSKAQCVLEELPVRNVVTWNVLIAGYLQQRQAKEALKCFDDMVQEGHCPDTVTFICVLKACGNIGATAKGEEIHDKLVSLGILEKDIVFGNALVDMYAKFGTLSKAKKVLKMLPIRDVVTWNALIAGYIQQQHEEEALKCFNDMLLEGQSPDAVTFSYVLMACGSAGAAAKGEEIHDNIVSLGMLEKDIVLGNNLVDMYAKCGALSKAQGVLEELPSRNVVTWSALIAGYVQHRKGERALQCLDDMLHEGHSPDAVTFICALKACGSIGAAAKGEEIHDKIVSLGMLEKDIALGNTLVNMYTKCGALLKAQQVLEELSVRNMVSWNQLIAVHAQQEQGEEALKCFDYMLLEGYMPDAVTFFFVLKACGSIRSVAKGEEIHDKIINFGMLEKDIVLVNSLVEMYVNCGALAKAQQVLEGLPIRDVVSWNTLIAGYVQHGHGEEALKCFNDMLCERHSPNVITFICVLKACGIIGAVAKGEEIHNKIVKLGMLEKDIRLVNSLLDMYVKCGALAKAQQMLKVFPVRDVVIWNVLIAGHVQQGQGEEALKHFKDMLHEGYSPDAITFISVLKACGIIGAAAKCEEIYDKIVCLGMLETDSMLGTVLVEMYAKKGALGKAQLMLEELPVVGVVTWNALIAGYAQWGKSLEVINCFEMMQANGVKPDSITLTSVLYACSHSGLLDEAETYFLQMSKYEIHPNSEHYCCMIDLYGRAGKTIKALLVIVEMPPEQSLPCWIALLATCRKWGEVKIAALAFEHALHLGKRNPAVYTLMADIYRTAGMQEEERTLKL